jgi:hypothetical protein
MTDHLNGTQTDRGFTRYPPLPNVYGGHVRVYESSSASGPHVWLQATAPQNANNPTGVLMDDVAVLLTAEDAWRLSEQIQVLVRNHYQGDARPPWAIGSDEANADD